MGAAIEVITGQATNPGATITQLTANSGDSYAVRSTDVAADIELWNAWAFTTTNLLMRIRSPRMHDQAQNWRGQPPASTPRPLIGLQPSQRLYSQDNIIVELTGGAAEVDPISSATAGNYGAAVALNSAFDTLIRNVDYAILGYECATTGCTFGIRGADTGNL